MIIITCITVAHREEGAKCLTQPIIDIHPGLERIETFGLLFRVLGKGLYMIVAYITAERETWTDIEILAYAIEQRTREFLIQTHVMGAYTDDVISASVAKPYSYIALR